MTSCSELEEETDEEGISKKNCSREMNKTVAALKALPICLNWGQIFSFPNETRQHMVIALQHSEIYAEKVKGAVEMSETPVQCASCSSIITFTDDNLLLGSKPHNRPLFVAGYINEQKVDCILINGESAVTVMPKATIHDLGITIEELSKTRAMIKGFNIKGQLATGMIYVKLAKGDLSTSSIFHVTDTKISYKLLLGRLWIYEHGIVASTLHQCPEILSRRGKQDKQ